PARGIARTDRDVTVRTNGRRRAFARKELFAVTIQTRRVLWEIRDVGKCRVSFTHFLPILRRDLMTGIAGQLLCDDVSLMRELCVIDFRFWRNCTFLRSR